MDFFILAFVLVILGQVRTTNVSRADFIESLERMSEPVVLVKKRRLLNLFRYHYVCIYKGHKIGLLSFKEIELPIDTDVITV